MNLPGYTGSPTTYPTDVPSVIPTETPSEIPTNSPSGVPSVTPTNVPSHLPTTFPSSYPSFTPSHNPSVHPTDVPSQNPSKNPTPLPSVPLTNVPTGTPSLTSDQTFQITVFLATNLSNINLDEKKIESDLLIALHQVLLSSEFNLTSKNTEIYLPDQIIFNFVPSLIASELEKFLQNSNTSTKIESIFQSLSPIYQNVAIQITDVQAEDDTDDNTGTTSKDAKSSDTVDIIIGVTTSIFFLICVVGGIYWIRKPKQLKLEPPTVLEAVVSRSPSRQSKRLEDLQNEPWKNYQKELPLGFRQAYSNSIANIYHD